ncbi:hypothetical protein AF72_09340 [Xylella taiwanensis]|uniref:Uncharacterized protein n=1 Tax=Xylella taiwanensis TaxID=1444770 RepID=Z9JI94_9GAMM|nr:hypothetical protein AF72_09340 [Xylella taiwanensis]
MPYTGPNITHADAHMADTGNDYKIVLVKQAINPHHTKQVNGHAIHISTSSPFEIQGIPQNIINRAGNSGGTR